MPISNERCKTALSSTVFVILATGLPTLINTAGAVVGTALTQFVSTDVFGSLSMRQVASDAAAGTAIGYGFLSLLMLASDLYHKKQNADFLSDLSKNAPFIAGADIPLSFFLPAAYAFFVVKIPINETGLISASAGIGASILLLSLMIARSCGMMALDCTRSSNQVHPATDANTVRITVQPVPPPLPRFIRNVNQRQPQRYGEEEHELSIRSDVVSP